MSSEANEERLREVVAYCARIANTALDYDTHKQSSRDVLFNALWRIEYKTEQALKEVYADE